MPPHCQPSFRLHSSWLQEHYCDPKNSSVSWIWLSGPFAVWCALYQKSDSTVHWLSDCPSSPPVRTPWEVHWRKQPPERDHLLPGQWPGQKCRVLQVFCRPILKIQDSVVTIPRDDALFFSLEAWWAQPSECPGDSDFTPDTANENAFALLVSDFVDGRSKWEKEMIRRERWRCSHLNGTD